MAIGTEPNSTPNNMPMNTGNICTCCNFFCALPTVAMTASIESMCPTKLSTSPNCKMVSPVGTSSTPARLSRETTTSRWRMSRTFLPNACSCVTTTRTERKSVPLVDKDSCTNSPKTNCTRCRCCTSPTKCTISPSLTGISEFGMTNSSARLMREQITSLPSNPGMSRIFKPSILGLVMRTFRVFRPSLSLPEAFSYASCSLSTLILKKYRISQKLSSMPQMPKG